MICEGEGLRRRSLLLIQPAQGGGGEGGVGQRALILFVWDGAAVEVASLPGSVEQRRVLRGGHSLAEDKKGGELLW